MFPGRITPHANCTLDSFSGEKGSYGNPFGVPTWLTIDPSFASFNSATSLRRSTIADERLL